MISRTQKKAESRKSVSHSESAVSFSIAFSASLECRYVSNYQARKRWEDNIREWTGLEFGKSQRAVENGEKWRKLVAKSSVVPQRPSRLRD